MIRYKNPVTGTSHKVILGPNGAPVSYVEEQKVPDRIFSEARVLEEERKPLIGNTQRHHRHIARIPATVYYDLKRRGIWDDEKSKLKWLEGEGQKFIVTNKRGLT